MYSSLFVFLISGLYFNEVSAEFNKHFADFVEENYGKTFLDTLQRTDLGDSGSFGGKNNENEEIKNDPIIFIHGVSDIAGGKMQALAATYKKHGYTNAELYATTYDSGPKNSPIAWAEYSLKCEHVKQIRTLILAVKYYTQRDVDIVAYSLGVPIARKAILGGVCVDTKEDLGSPLTQYVDSFIGVAGPNHGISLQVAGVSIPGCVIGAIPILPICSKVIGLYSGFCPTESQFLTDINESNHYEGRYVYSIYTETDGWIGYQICDKVTARIPGEDGHKLYKKLSHDDVILRTCDMQIQMMQYHTTQSDFDVKSRNVTSQQRGRRFKVERSSESGSRSKSGQTKKRDISDYDYLSETSEAIFENTPAKFRRSSKISSNKIAIITTYTPETNTKGYLTTTRSYESYLPRTTNRDNVIDMINARPYQMETRRAQSEGVADGGYHTHVNVSFD